MESLGGGGGGSELGPGIVTSTVKAGTRPAAPASCVAAAATAGEADPSSSLALSSSSGSEQWPAAAVGVAATAG